MKKRWVIDDEFFAILEKYYKLILTGGGASPNKKPFFTRVQVDRTIKALDGAFKDELRTNPEHWANKGIDLGPNFNRLWGGARLALVQELSKCYKKFENQPRCAGCRFLNVVTCTHPESKMVQYGIATQEVVNPSRNACEYFEEKEVK
ncbi:hypothetical protein LCGC14_0514450 [marine sediment metagenome]|uniref:Uncharacterized protein n=1 Tax=marine sediment metagenome TaxID=412755 RepID=A0A0F9ULS3_9ZZZZ